MTHTYSTCITCGTWLMVVDHGQTAHPGCDTALDELTARFLEACAAGDDDRADQLAAAMETADRRPTDLGRAALAYAAWGWPVFPLQPGGKTPATRRGFKDATTDEATVRRWWRDNPTANIGLPTGHRFDVVDVDMPTGTWPWVELRDSGKLPDVHGVALTPRGGLHVYLAATGGGNMAGFRPGLDYRGRGGYVVAAPSRRDDGGRYSWSVRPSPLLTGLDGGDVPSSVRGAA